ncbi:pyridoxamine 5'-phosphate oxidase family protein [Umezawaea sp. Da 62-37]|uniref:pyridoxamine 5'-phosphate oxidase family protein n=1 Tax=Umezawaea sp. Da 62-37 TaxID=3075927 RepID=UPI0028F74E90|nr:pyridoxamine 5'-phosphate oxidase family protein [Umezawaea sp. Da 62-37]WNV84371.1 pyridoxamine 5'-phosphate oxidase family protein [Umezawaea sp. Da 62-37]
MTIVETTSEVEAVVRDTLAVHQSFFLATSGSAGPWVNGAYFAETGLFTLSLVLEQRGRSLAAIRDNPVVSVIISTGSPTEPFLQAQATARIVEDAEADEVRRVLLAKVPQVEPFLGTPVAAVELRVLSWRATDIPNGWLPGRDLYDTSIPVAREHRG